MVIEETARVWRAAGRRWFTKQAAERAEAKAWVVARAWVAARAWAEWARDIAGAATVGSAARVVMTGAAR